MSRTTIARLALAATASAVLVLIPAAAAHADTLPGSAVGQGAGKVSVEDMSFTRYVDKSSPDLLLNACNGKHIDKAVLAVRKAGEQPLEYLMLTWEDIAAH